MALVHLSSKKLQKYRIIKSLYLCIAAALLIAAKPSIAAESFDSYEGLGHRLMGLIGSSQKRVWIKTTYLTDQHLVTGLKLAKFRGVDIRVILDSKKARYYMSRYRDLLKDGISTKITKGKWSNPTSILVDGKIYSLSIPLNSKVTTRFITMRPAPSSSIAMFERDFSSLRRTKNVRRSSPKNSVSKPVRRSSTKGAKSKQSVYTYTNKKETAPSGVQTKLPKKTKWQQNR